MEPPAANAFSTCGGDSAGGGAVDWAATLVISSNVAAARPAYVGARSLLAAFRRRAVRGGGLALPHLSAHAEMASMAAVSARPFFVKAYSTRTGVSGMTVRSTMPSASSSCSRSLSMRSVMSGMASRSVANRQRSLSSTNRIAPVHGGRSARSRDGIGRRAQGRAGATSSCPDPE